MNQRMPPPLSSMECHRWKSCSLLILIGENCFGLLTLIGELHCLYVSPNNILIHISAIYINVHKILICFSGLKPVYLTGNFGLVSVFQKYASFDQMSW